MTTYLNVTAHGGYSTGTWSGEVAQCGWNLAVQDEDPTTTIATNEGLGEFDYDDTAATGAWASGTYQSGFGGILDVAVQEALAVAVTTWMNVVDQFQVSGFSWDRISMALFQYDVTVVPNKWIQKEEQSTFSLTTPIAGDVSTTGLPPQGAVAISHYTNGTGSRNRGRVYVPFHKGVPFSTQLLAAGDNTILGNAEAALFDAIAAIEVNGGGSFLVPAVVSRVHQTFSTVTQVRVGDEIDTQRRRRNARAETYESYVWPTV